MERFSAYIVAAFLYFISGSVFAATMDLDLVSFTGPALDNYPNATWSIRTNTNFHFEDLDVSGNELTGGRLIHDYLWAESYDNGSYLGGFAHDGEYYLDLSLRNYNVFSATFNEITNIYSVTVASMFSSPSSPYPKPMTFQLTPSPVSLPPAVMLFLSGIAAFFVMPKRFIKKT